MFKSMLYAALLVVVILQPGMASVEEYTQIDRERNSAFLQSLQKEIQKALPHASNEVQHIYQEIGYRPVWVKSDELSADAVLLLGEIKDDLANGALKALQPEYDRIVQEEERLSAASPLEEKATLELHIMQPPIQIISAISPQSRS